MAEQEPKKTAAETLAQEKKELETGKDAKYLEDQKSSKSRFELPSGYFDEVNGILYDYVLFDEMSGEEEDIMASEKLEANFRLSKVLTNCTIELSDKDGKHVIKDKEKLGAIISENLLSGDRLFMLVVLRRVSLGDDIMFPVKCPRILGYDKNEKPILCGEEQIVKLDLSILKVTMLADKKIRFYTEALPSGKKVKIKYIAGGDEREVSDAIESKESMMSKVLLSRVAEIDGVPATMVAIKKMKVRDRQHLRNILQRQNPGIERTLTITCGKCNHEWDNSIGLESASFFFPGGQTA